MLNNTFEEKIIQLLTDLVETQKKKLEELANIRDLFHRELFLLNWTTCQGPLREYSFARLKLFIGLFGENFTTPFIEAWKDGYLKYHSRGLESNPATQKQNEEQCKEYLAQLDHYFKPFNYR